MNTVKKKKSVKKYKPNDKKAGQSEEIQPYEMAEFIPKPTAIVKFARQNILIQFIRFCFINLKMIRVIWNSHN